MGFVSPRPPGYFEERIVYVEYQKDPFGKILAVAITEEASDFDDWYFFYVDELEVDPDDVIRNPQNYKIVGQASAWAKIVRA